MHLPLNGRVAIVEDNINEAKPLMSLFAQERVPYIYFQGDEIAMLPEEAPKNDIRILFLDINLINHGTPTHKEIKSIIYSVVNKLISEDNFPYVLIYWSKQEDEYANLVAELFSKELKKKAPITIKRFVKTQFFSLDGSPIENELNLKEELIKVLSEELSYCALIGWENLTHQSSNKTLQEVFGSYSPDSDWQKEVDNLLYKLGSSYSGHHFVSQEAQDKLKSSFNTLNTIFDDTVETVLNSLCGLIKLPFNKPVTKNLIIWDLNRKLLFSNDLLPDSQSGSILELTDPAYTSHFNRLFNGLVPSSVIKNKLPENFAKEVFDAKRKEIVSEVRQDSLNLAFIVTPLCDYANKKDYFIRLILGAFVKADKHDLLDKNSEAFYYSPPFIFNEKEFRLVLDFKHFFTLPKIPIIGFKKVLRARQQLLAEIQSKLSRHINRQGILFIE
jgi:hypothetical protein